MPEIVQLLASPVHRFEGRPVDGPAPAPPGELVDEIQLRAGLGIVGDRYFGHAAHRGSVLTLDSGAGPVRLRVRRPANPCAWMDATIGPGAWRALRGKGGIRCTPLDDGVLRVGPVSATVTGDSGD